MDPIASSLSFLTLAQPRLRGLLDCRSSLCVVRERCLVGSVAICVGSHGADVLVEAGEDGEAGAEQTTGEFGEAG